MNQSTLNPGDSLLQFFQSQRLWAEEIIRNASILEGMMRMQGLSVAVYPQSISRKLLEEICKHVQEHKNFTTLTDELVFTETKSFSDDVDKHFRLVRMNTIAHQKFAKRKKEGDTPHMGTISIIGEFVIVKAIHDHIKEKAEFILYIVSEDFKLEKDNV